MLFENYRDKRVLVTGHTGFKGAWLCFWLKHLGATVAGFSNDIPTTPSLFETLKLSTLVEDFRGDIRDFPKVKTSIDNFRPDIVFHLAAQSIISQGLEEPRECFETNVMGTVNVLESLRQAKYCKAVVVVTSDKCYENSFETIHKEEDKLGGENPYSSSKAGAELVFQAYYKSFLKKLEIFGATARSGNVIGGGDWGPDRLVPDCYRAWLNKTPLILRSASSVRPWQYVLDVLSGYLILGLELLRGNQLVAGESFNFGPESSDSYPVSHIVGLFQKAWNGLLSENSTGDKFPECETLRLNSGKSQRILQWRSLLEFEGLIQETASWYREFLKGSEMVDLSREQLIKYEKEFRLCPRS